MNTPTPNRPGIVCRLVRRWAAIGGDPEGSRLGSNHIAHCGACATFFAAGHTLDRSLRRDAADVQVSAPAGLEQRIVRAVRLSGPTTAARPASFRALTVALAAAAAIALAAVFLHQPTPPPHLGSETNGTSRVARNFSGELPADPAWSSLRPAAVDLLTRNPLEEEAAAVFSDAQSAVRFLAMNFLPGAADTPARRANGG